MSFNIFAAGAANGQGFHYQRDDCIDGDDFVVAELINTLSSMNQTAIGVAQSSVETITSKLLPGGAADGMGVIAFLEFLHVLKNAIDSLAMCDDAGNGRIAVFSKKVTMFWEPDILRNSCYYFSPGNDPGKEFIQTIGKTLEDTDMNNWGVLRAMVIVLTKFSDLAGQSGKPLLTIQLDK